MQTLLGIVFVLFLVFSLVAISVSADTPSWSVENIPSTTDNILGPPGVDIIDMAVNGNTIYIATKAGTTFRMYKSIDAGATWVELGPGPKIPDDIKLIAVSIDDPNEVVAVDTSNEAWYSSNGGDTFDNLQVTDVVNVWEIDIS